MAPEIVKGGSQGHDMVTRNFSLLILLIRIISYVNDDTIMLVLDHVAELEMGHSDRHCYSITPEEI